ncbi:hypothetical protein BX600DRAFT_546082 [Xylariales sp. PMI_506]|nr:hypothetical protein BX600DRAFT_546082 [Xylariales sp. PMI_506]
MAGASLDAPSTTVVSPPVSSSRIRSLLGYLTVLIGIFSVIFVYKEALWLRFSKIATFSVAPKEYFCPPPAYTVRTFSYSPLVIHLENFVTLEEREYLISLGMPLLKPSFIHDQNSGGPKRTPKRTSSSAFLPSDDAVVNCIRQRALTFQGHRPARLLESLQVVRYTEGQRFNMHYDWGKPVEGYGDRETTFFATLMGDCERCGTHFPRIDIDWTGKDRDEWCRFIECEGNPVQNGTVFRAFEGGAVFWRNMDDDGVGDKRNLHGGMPLVSGEKIGLNIWTRQG